jgi:hypothetical protein
MKKESEATTEEKAVESPLSLSNFSLDTMEYRYNYLAY